MLATRANSSCPAWPLALRPNYDWGGAATADLVNSVKTIIGSLPSGGNLSIDLLAPTRTDLPAGLTNPIGVWDFVQGGGLNIGSADLTFRYDDALAASMSIGERR